MTWVESWSQWTAYIDGKRHRLGKDEEDALRQFKFLCRQTGDGGEADPNITSGEVSLAFMTAAAEQHTKGVLFPNTQGNPWSSASLQIYLLQLQTKFKEAKKLNWQEGLCMYGLRHTFATAFLAVYPNEIEYLRVLLGHKDYQMILKHYGHLVDQTEQITKRLKNFDPFGGGHMAAEM